MSRKATDWAWRFNASCSTVKLVLLALADRADDFGECYPSVGRLEVDTGLNRKTIIKATHELELAGAIIDTKKRKGATQRVKVYRLTTEIETVPKAESFPKRNSSKNGTLNSSKNGTLNSTNNGTQNQSVEPPIEPLTDHSASKGIKSSEKWFEILWEEYANLTFEGKKAKNGCRKKAFTSWEKITKGFDYLQLKYQVNVCLAFQEMRLADKTWLGTKQHCVAYLNQEVWLSDDAWLQSFNEQYQQTLAVELSRGAEYGNIN